MCGLFEWKCYVVGDNPVQQLLKDLDKSIIDSCTQGLTSLGTVWLKTPTPDLTGGSAPSVSGTAPDAGNIATVLGYLTWIGLALAIMSLLALGGLVAVRIRSGEGLTAIGRLGAVLGGVLLLSGGTAIVAAALPSGPHGVGGATAFVQDSLWWYMVAAAIGSVIIGAIRMIWEQRAQPGKDLLKSLLTLIIVSAGAVTIIDLLLRAGDSFSTWIIDNAMACDNGSPGCFVASLKKVLDLTENTGAGNGILMMIIIALAELLTLLIQIVLVVARSGMLVLLAGVLPIAAAATNTEMGASWFKRCIAWLVAFLLYKPVASLVYAAAYRLIITGATNQDKLLSALTGAMLLILSVMTLPALLRFVAPMTSAASGGHGAGAAALGAVAARLPTGARAAAGAGQQAAAQGATTTTTTSVRSATGSANQAGARQAAGATNGAGSGASGGADAGAGSGSGGQQTASPGTTSSGAGGSSGTAPASTDPNGSASGSTSGSTSGSGGSQPGGSQSEGGDPKPASGAGESSAHGGFEVTTITETSAPAAQPQPSRGRRYSAPVGTGGLVHAAALAASAAHAVAQEATGSHQ